MSTWWGAEWHSVNKIDGETRRILWHNGKPLLFHTRKEAREWVNEKYGFIKERKDLQQEPHGWKVPHVVPVEVIIQKVQYKKEPKQRNLY